MAAPSPSAGAPPPPPPPISDVVVTSHEVVTATLVSLIGGLFFLVLWAAVRGPMRLIYQKRTQISSLHARPPPLRLDGLLHRCLGYLAPIFLITDGELLETAGLDAMMLCRFLALSLQVFVPTAAVCCAVLIPLTRTGTAVEQNSEYANTASLMRYTLSNVEEGSIKLWAPFALSYLVLAHTAFVLHLHYQSFALLRLLHIRHGVHGATPDISPQMKIVGYERRGWREAAHMLLTTTSAWHMYQDDLRHVRQLVALHQSAELQALHQAAELEPALKHMSSSNDAAELSLVLPRSGGNASVPAAAGGSPHESSFEAQQGAGRQKGEGKVAAVDDAGSDTGGAGGGGLPAVLPWWLPPEQIPPEVSAEYGSSGVLAGKVSCVLRRRVHGTTPAGRHVWSCAAQYAVLWLVEGPPPSQELSSLLRSQGAASQPQAPSIEVHGGSRLDGTPTPPAGRGCGWRQALVARLRSGARSSSSVGNAQAAGPAADAVAAQLEGALRALFPSSFSGLVRVYNHSSCDHLLAKHEHAATQRDCCLTDVAAARCTLDAAEAAATAAAAKIKPGQAAAASAVTNKKLSRRVQAAAAKLAEREAELARRQAETLALEQQVVAARKEALAQPLGTAFIALFRTQAAARMAVHFESSVLPSGNFVVGPAPGPDNINWPALWCPWGQRWWRAVAVVPPLVVAMLFPIGALTGALSNLNTAVCGGTPETNSLYWPWYCNTDNFWVKLVKSLLQSILPSIISTCWDTYVMPLAFYYLAQIERRHVSLRALDRRITVLFYNFAATNTFLGAVLGGTVFMQIGSLLSNPERWLQVLATALPAASTYFIDYTIIHGLCINLFRFVWPHDGTVLFVLFRWVGLFRPRCERDHCMIRSTPSFRAGRHYGSFLLIQIMALSYAVIAPLLLPIATFFFLTAWVAWRYSCLHFYERSYESGGRLFETLFTLVVWTMAIFTTFSSLVLASKKAWSASLIMLITQLPLLYTFHRNVKMSTGHYAKVVPLQATLQAPLAEVDPAMYLPPPLREGAVGWYPEWGKVWEKYGIGRYAW